MSKAGNNVRLVNMAKKSVREVSKPRATVPPKSEKTKITNPKNRIMEV